MASSPCKGRVWHYCDKQEERKTLSSVMGNLLEKHRIKPELNSSLLKLWTLNSEKNKFHFFFCEFPLQCSLSFHLVINFPSIYSVSFSRAHLLVPAPNKEHLIYGSSFTLFRLLYRFIREEEIWKCKIIMIVNTVLEIIFSNFLSIFNSDTVFIHCSA